MKTNTQAKKCNHLSNNCVCCGDPECALFGEEHTHPTHTQAKKCWWIFNHDWENWKDVGWGKDKQVIRETNFIQQYIVQTRDCKKCNKTQIRKAQTI